MTDARFISSSGVRCHFPVMYVFHPRSPSTSATVPHSNGMWPLELGKPDAASVIVPMPLVVWLRPVIRHERVGEHSAVVWKFV